MLPQISLLPLLGVLAVAQDLSPPCIRKCYDNNPGPSSCNVPDGGPAVTPEGLARCTCSTFAINRGDPLYRCLLRCPVDQQTKYLQGWTTETYGCADKFPDVDEQEVDAGRTDDPKDNGGSGGGSTQGGGSEKPSETTQSAASDANPTDGADKDGAAAPGLKGSMMGVVAVVAAGGVALVLNS